ncbi:nuclear transport factor 2 family protein [Rhizosphaericola mali]|uniref:Nuclear transport factor 2 family protein n=1 Tax=Rhizosphaericola mali TaxID=2545455 RepID=A0A5P2FXA1_9BACT|nr:nuclear transport factor 2 family protein [Rhizosphaericola mali]QES87815.1 nuclear transport factor 2 family protein [Rhizosphaericola mali]
MKIKIFSLFLFSIILLGITSKAQYKIDKEKSSIVSTLQRFKQAMLDSDTSILSDLTDNQLTYGHSTGKLQDKKAFLASFATGLTDFTKIDILDERIQYFDDVAVVRHILSADTDDNKTPGHTDLKILLVWKWEKNKWKLITRQAVKI